MSYVFLAITLFLHAANFTEKKNSHKLTTPLTSTSLFLIHFCTHPDLFISTFPSKLFLSGLQVLHIAKSSKRASVFTILNLTVYQVLSSFFFLLLAYSIQSLLITPVPLPKFTFKCQHDPGLPLGIYSTFTSPEVILFP